MALMLVALAGGCATLDKGPSDEELIAATMEAMQSAIAAQDLDKIMDVYSEDFSGENGEGKAEVRDFIANWIDMGVMEEVEVNIEEMETTIENGTATVAPVVYESSFGQLVAEYTLQKEENTWRVVGASIEF
jgi:ketosteroid isomerase-like protein